MKKTLTVNLSGIVYHIDEDAYLLLDKYLEDIRSHLKQSVGMQEVMDDIENRISELFSDTINQGCQVVTIADVNRVISRMGSPEAYSETSDFDAEIAGESNKTGGKVKKKLYRDPDDKILGGVASGIAAYIGCDPTWVRLVIVVSIIGWGIVIPAYIVCWIVIPPAETSAEKLEMRGREVNLENIGKTVTETFNKVGDQVSSLVNSKKTRSTVQKIGDLLVCIVSIGVKFLAILTGLFAALSLFALAIGFVSVLAVYFSGKTMALDIIANSPFAAHPEVILLLVFSGIFILGIPMFAIFYTMFKNTFRWSSMSAVAKWTLAFIWFLSVFVSIYFGIYLAN